MYMYIYQYVQCISKNIYNFNDMEVHKIIFFFFRPVKKAKVGPKTPGTAKKKSMNDHFELCTLLVHVHV